MRQIMVEIKKLMSSKFLLIIGILILLSSIAVPVINALTPENGYNGGGPIMYEMDSIHYDKAIYPGGGGNGEPITIDGITITNENPFYWEISSRINEKNDLERSQMFTTPEALDLALDLINEELSYYVGFAEHITTYQDYRFDLVWNGVNSLYDLFIYEHTETADPEALREASQFRIYLEPDAYEEKYINISAEQRLAAIDSATENLNQLSNVIKNNDFGAYIALRIQQENDNIKNVEEQIEIQEKAIADNPSQEENLSQYIEELQKQIELIRTNFIPILEYRLEKTIIPYEDVWQNRALDEISNSRNQLSYTTIVSEEEFNQERYLALEYGSYANYVATMNAQINELNNKILIAQKSLDADMPDMKFVTDGARFITVQFLGYSIFVALFAILLGGWIIASEFQLGTIRLLMIRPKTRTKILINKFLAALIISFAIYIAGSLLNILVNGICFGFADFGFPNFTVSGDVGFFAYYLPKFVACGVSIIFAFCVAFMLSVVVKNIAVSISVPIVCFIGCFIAMNILAYTRAINWIAWTPIPYVQISSFFTQYTPVQTLIQRGIPVSLTYGIILLMALSAICTFISIWVFKKQDIKN